MITSSETQRTPEEYRIRKIGTHACDSLLDEIGDVTHRFDALNDAYMSLVHKMKEDKPAPHDVMELFNEVETFWEYLKPEYSSPLEFAAVIDYSVYAIIERIGRLDAISEVEISDSNAIEVANAVIEKYAEIDVTGIIRGIEASERRISNASFAV